MTREELAELLERYQDRTLDRAGAEQLAQAIREDPSALGELGMMGLLGEALGGDDEEGFARSLRERLGAEGKGTEFIRKLDARVAARGGAAVRRRRQGVQDPLRSAPWAIAVAGFAACVLFAVAVSSPPRKQDRPAPPASVVRVPEPERTEPVRPPMPERPRVVEPAPVPREQPRPAPRPEPAPREPDPPAVPPPAPGPAAPTRAEVARRVADLERVEGQAWRTGPGGRTLAATGQSVLPGEGLEVGPGTAALRFPDGLLLEARAATTLGPLPEGPVRRLALVKGTVLMDVPRQPPGTSLFVVTADAEVQVVGTRFSVTARAGSTQVDVEKGIVQVTRRSDRKSIKVSGGQQATVAAKTELVAIVPSRFVKGINFNGDAVTIEGNRWLSHAEALADGLTLIPATCTVDRTTVAPEPAVDADTAAMLNTCVWMQMAPFGLKQRISNGVYDISFWEIENLQTGFREFRIRAEGTVVVRNAGGLPFRTWKKHGPFRVVVADGTLDVDLVNIRGDPSLMGMTIFTAPLRIPR